MDMSLEDTLATLGLDNEATVPAHWQGRGWQFFSLSLVGGPGIIEGTLGSRRGRICLPLAPPGVTWTLSAGRGPY